MTEVKIKVFGVTAQSLMKLNRFELINVEKKNVEGRDVVILTLDGVEIEEDD